MKPALIYSHRYFLDLGDHVFPGEKYRLVYELLQKKRLLDLFDWLSPHPASLEDLSLVHSQAYLDSLFALKQNAMTAYSEIPLTKSIVEAFVLSTGGTILAAEEALKRGAAGNIGGGFHHAFSDHAEGFCYINDLAVVIRVLQSRKKIKKAAVIDCDLHQGNGTARIFAQDPSVFTFSIHQENNYPPKEESNWDIGLPDFADDALYLSHLEKAVPKILDSFQPDLVLYQAGADPYEEDQLGQLCVTKEGLKKRDWLVFSHCKRRGIAVAVTLGGGYARDVKDTVEIHAATFEAMLECFKG
jgi:acetoin utilization deacetylase AcuC-like enzyme